MEQRKSINIEINIRNSIFPQVNFTSFFIREVEDMDKMILKWAPPQLILSQEEYTQANMENTETLCNIKQIILPLIKPLN